MPHYEIDSTILNAVDYSRFSGILDGTSDMNCVAGKEHYKLLSYLSTMFNGYSIVSIGTHRGYAALALSYNPENTVYSFGPTDRLDPKIRERENIVFSTDDWKARVATAPFIFLDIGDHQGTQEFEIYTYLKEINYQGFVICDNIWYFKEMRDNFWYKLPIRYDLTHVGHWAGTGIFTFNSDITFPTYDTKDWTLVTAYFDLTKCPDASEEIKKRDSTHYLQNAVSTMALTQNLVVYCEAGSIEALKALRPAHLAAKTRYVVCEFDKLTFEKAGSPLKETFATYRGKIQAGRAKNPYYFDNRNTASYYLLCMSRYVLLKEVIEENPFGSSHFAWINICIERMGYKNVQRLDEGLAVYRDKFSTCYIDYVPEELVQNTPEYYKWGRCSMCSGFFTGNAHYMAKVCDLVEDKFLEYLALGYGHADEQLFSAVYFQNKDLFEHYYGDYRQMITNYKYIYDAPEPPIYNFIRNSYKHKNYAKCKEACDFVWRSLERNTVFCPPQFVTELQNFRNLLRLLV